MDRFCVDLGVETFPLGSGVLRFNPTDPNLYTRFMDMEPQLQQLRQQLLQETQQAQDAASVLKSLEQTDRQFKQLLTQVFGQQNDFSKLLEGVNLLAVTQNGVTVAENLLSALEPVLTQGAQRFVQAQTRAAVEKARQRRENQ